MILPRVLALVLAAALPARTAFTQSMQPTPSALLAERAFPVPVDVTRLVRGQASVAGDDRITIAVAGGESHGFRLAGITFPTGRQCLHPGHGGQVDCVELTRQTLAALLANREVGCPAPPSQAGECYLAYDGAWYSVNRLLVRSGMVKALAPRYIEAERRSRADGAGLWDPVVYPTDDGWRELTSYRANRSGGWTGR